MGFFGGFILVQRIFGGFRFKREGNFALFKNNAMIYSAGELANFTGMKPLAHIPKTDIQCLNFK